MPSPPQHAHPVSTLAVRGDELDRTGTVGAAQLLRYLEHGRWQATAQATEALGPLFAEGRKMVVRAQRLQLYAAAQWQDELEIATWLVRLGRTSVDMGHRLTRRGDGALVAEALLTGVQIDDAGQPTPLAAGLQPTPEPPVLDPALHALQFSAEPQTDLWTWTQVIRPSQTDLFGHVNHSRYADLFDDARWFAEQAKVWPQWQANRSLLRIAVEYRREAKAGETVHVQLSRRDPQTLEGYLSRDGELLSRALLVVSPPR